LALVNSGTIDASGGDLSLYPSTMTNAGTLEASPGNGLFATANTLSNTGIGVAFPGDA
jgi:hypothetical protein